MWVVELCKRTSYDGKPFYGIVLADQQLRIVRADSNSDRMRLSSEPYSMTVSKDDKSIAVSLKDKVEIWTILGELKFRYVLTQIFKQPSECDTLQFFQNKGNAFLFTCTVDGKINLIYPEQSNCVINHQLDFKTSKIIVDSKNGKIILAKKEKKDLHRLKYIDFAKLQGEFSDETKNYLNMDRYQYLVQ